MYLGIALGWIKRALQELAQVRVVLAGVDKFDNLFGSVVYADAEERPVDLGEQLLRTGLARVRDQPCSDGPRPSAWFVQFAVCLSDGM